MQDSRPSLTIAGRRIAADTPAYFIAEMSANHGQSFDHAVEIVRAAKEAGADAVKLQTYTPDTITLNSDAPAFVHRADHPLWGGRALYELYQEAYTPWDWQPKLKAIADDLGIALFSSPFDGTAVDFLEAMDVPAYKIASFELIDVPLIRKIAQTGKPMILSTGMGTVAEIDEAVRTARSAGATEIALLQCTSSYPAPIDEANLATIPHLGATFGVVPGLSDHTMTPAVPIAAVVLGARVVEKHFTLRRDDGGPDSAFSLEPHEFAEMVTRVREAESAIGHVRYGPTERETQSLQFRRSLFVAEDIQEGETLTPQNVRSVRPAGGLHPRELDGVLGKRAARDVAKGTPLSWELIRS